MTLLTQYNENSFRFSTKYGTRVSLRKKNVATRSRKSRAVSFRDLHESDWKDRPAHQTKIK